MKRVIVLGSTGSIGTSALKVARDIPERMKIVGIAAHRSSDKLAEQAAETGAGAVCIVDESRADGLQSQLPNGTNLFTGEQGLVDLVQSVEADMVLIAIVGTGGLKPALAAIEAGMDIAVASKEILVMAGESVMTEAKKHEVNVLPVDSEHNAIFQCLAGGKSEEVTRLILTASGGPFRTLPAEELSEVSVERALKHPTWDMGPKITIDSATLFNKGLEMIEARWLFGVEMSKVDVIVHPQSIVHSMVEFVDGSIIAQLSHSDMCFPIQYAVTWPDRVANTLQPLDFAELRSLEFEAPRYDDFPSLNLARRAGDEGGVLPAVLNAANEIAVSAFVEGRIRFPSIWETVAQVMDRCDNSGEADLATILQADSWAREEAKNLTN